MLTSDVCWGSLGTSIFGSSSSAANSTRSRLPSTLSFHLLRLWLIDLEGCMILVLWFTDCYAVVIIFISLPKFYNTKIKQQSCVKERYHIKSFTFCFYFVAIFVAFAPSCFFLLTAVSACIRPCDTNNFFQSLTRMYPFNEPESPWHLCGVKSLTPTLA